MPLWNVFYDTPQGTKAYCASPMSQIEAIRMLAEFSARYLGPDGKGKAYPNGKGRYAISNARIAHA